MLLLTRAVSAVAPDIPAGLNIDVNNDGMVDNICFIVSGDLEGWGDWVMWPHMGEFPPSTAWINGKQVKRYNVQLRDFLFGELGWVSALCHEFFHTLGAPDLYHYSNQPPDPVGPWDLMDSPGIPTAYGRLHEISIRRMDRFHSDNLLPGCLHTLSTVFADEESLQDPITLFIARVLCRRVSQEKWHI